MQDSEKDWKIKLRYGKAFTPYMHYTLIGNGIATDLKGGFECANGRAFMGMKIWAATTEEAARVFVDIGEQIGFVVTGSLEIYESDPIQPPGEEPSAYDINFTPIA